MKTLATLNKYILKYKWHFVTGTIFVIISNIFGIFIAPLVRRSINLVEGQVRGADESTYAHIMQEVLFYGGLILGTSILKGLFMFFMRQTIIVASRRIEYDMKNDIFEQYQKLSASFYKQNYTGDLMNRISEDVSRVRMYFGPAIMYFINIISLFAIVISIMLSINVELTLYSLLPLPFLSIGIYYVNNLINKKSDLIQSQLSTITTFTQETFSGIRVLKSFGVEEKALENLERENEQYKKRSLNLAYIESWFFPLIMFLVGLSTLLVIYIGGMQVIKGELTIGHIAEFVIYVNMLTWPVASLGWTSSLVQRAIASQQRINAFLDEKPAVVSGNVPVKHLETDIRFENVKLVFDVKRRPALNGISFTIKKGSRFGIIGTTGSGKSTIATLLLRHFDATEGRILINNEDIRNLKLQDLRRLIGYVPQEVFLFSDSVRENVMFGAGGEVTDDDIKRVTKQADVYKDIEGFPEGFSTMVGEKGITLSGGQKQRLSLARALLRDPEILILDDVLSAVDTQTETAILQQFEEVMKNKTSIIISHRISSVINCDQVIMLEDGVISEQGTHAELMQLNGAYANLYRKQSLEEEQEVAR